MPGNINEVREKSSLKKGKDLKDKGFTSCVQGNGKACDCAGRLGTLNREPAVTCGRAGRQVTKSFASNCPHSPKRQKP
jgi:hypothetical protein